MYDTVQVVQFLRKIGTIFYYLMPVGMMNSVGLHHIKKNIVEKRITLESQTPDFLRSTFNNDSYHDIVYVTANPQTLKFQYELDK